MNDILHGSADASENPSGQQQQQTPQARSGANQSFAYRALIDLKAQQLIVDDIVHKLAPGMQVTAEIHLGSRTILEYLLSPVMGAFQEAGRER